MIEAAKLGTFKVAHPPFKGNPRLRPPGVTWEWTEEMLAEYARCATDMLYFVKNYIKIVTLPSKISKGGLVTMVPYPYQEEITKKIADNRFVICKLPRQSGKTTIIGAILLWHLLFNRNYMIALVANKAQNAEKILKSVKKSYEYLPAFLQQGLTIWNARRVECENGSFIQTGATTSSSIRGGTFNLIYIDEFCFIHPNMQDEFWTSNVPAISSGEDSKIILTSTPNGLDLFYDIWDKSERGENAFIRQEINWWDQPGRDDAWKKTQLELLGSQEKFDQEYNTEFLGSNGTLISGKALKAMTVRTPLEKTPAGLKIYERPSKDRSYVAVVDVARGVRLDYSAMVVVDITDLPYRVVATYRDNAISSMSLPGFVWNVLQAYNMALVLVESNDLGQRVAEDLLHEHEYENVVMTTVKAKRGTDASGGFGPQSRIGVMTNKQVKKIGCAGLKTLVEGRQLLNPCSDLKLEMSTFVAKGTSYEAEPGKHDDLIMCTVLFGWFTRQEYFREHAGGHDVRAAVLAENDRIRAEDLAPFGIVAIDSGPVHRSDSTAPGRDDLEEMFKPFNNGLIGYR
jgi:hypothetical protein